MTDENWQWNERPVYTKYTKVQLIFPTLILLTFPTNLNIYYQNTKLNKN